MQTTITAVFDSVDAAELAISRLRRSIPGFQVETAGGAGSASPADAACTASIFYPYQPINLPTDYVNQYNYELGGRVLFTADILGIPLYHDGETELKIRVEEASAGRARSLLVNAGGRRVR